MNIPTTMRAATGWVCIAALCLVLLSFLKNSQLHHYSQEKLAGLQDKNQNIVNLFRAEFYFYFEDHFKPEIQKKLSEIPDLVRFQIVSANHQILFDSTSNKEKILLKYNFSAPTVYQSGFQVLLFFPAGQYGMIYVFEAKNVKKRVLFLFTSGILILLFLSWFLSRVDVTTFFRQVYPRVKKGFGLRVKFLVTVVGMNLITGGVLFVSLVALQTKELSVRIERESLQFSRFTTTEIISAYSNYFYFNYLDKFVPSIKTILSSNENLISIKIISKRTNTIPFDSETALKDSLAQSPGEAPLAHLSSEIDEELKQKDQLAKSKEVNHQKYFSVFTVFRNDLLEPLFYVEYLFSYESIQRNIRLIQKQILVDLLPSILIGFIVALLFGQFLISPLRRLVLAFRKVRSGDYDADLRVHRSDEIGELISEFNQMTLELKKKKELRKFLSDSTYRQVMAAKDLSEKSSLGGKKVKATILFSDIRGFVSHCENREAEEVTSMLNEYFSQMVEVIYKHGGEVDKFIGDGILAVFYSAEVLPPLYCALEMLDRLGEFNKKRQDSQKEKIEIGIGITHGEIISGPIGSKDRMDFTVIGDVVNLASRIEKLSKNGKFTKIVFTKEVLDQVRDLMDCVPLSHEKIAGKEEEVQVYELIRLKNLGEIKKNLFSADSTLRQRSIELLGQSRNEEALLDVLEAMKDGDPSTRLSAVLALEKIASNSHLDIVNSLFEALKKETSDKTVSAILSVIGKKCRDEKILKLQPYLDSTNERIVANAVEALGQVQSPECLDLILPKLSSLNNRVKANAAMALFAAGHLEVLELLKPMCLHSNAMMRSSAAFALGELTLLGNREGFFESLKDSLKTYTGGIKLFLAELQQCVPILVALLDDPEHSVRKQAVVALGKMRDKSSLLPLIKLIDESKESKEILADITQALRLIGSHQLVREILSRFH